MDIEDNTNSVFIKTERFETDNDLFKSEFTNLSSFDQQNIQKPSDCQDVIERIEIKPEIAPKSSLDNEDQLDESEDDGPQEIEEIKIKTEAADHFYDESAEENPFEEDEEKNPQSLDNNQEENGSSSSSSLHNQKLDVSCPKCQQIFLVEQELQIHECLLKPVTQCQKCLNVFKNKSILQKHKCDYTSVTCKTCNTAFSRLSDYRTHRKTHIVAKFICSHCEKICTTASSLTNHLKVHKEKKILECEFCDRKFTKTGHYTEHMRIHTGQRRHQCPLCDYKAMVPSVLKRHSRVHTGEKLLCMYCNAQFSSKTGLDIHLRNHNGLKPFQCDLCSYKCSSGSSLKSHKRTHTGEKLYQCHFCDYKSAYTHDIRRHIGRKHTKTKEKIVVQKIK